MLILTEQISIFFALSKFYLFYICDISFESFNLQRSARMNWKRDQWKNMVKIAKPQYLNQFVNWILHTFTFEFYLFSPDFFFCPLFAEFLRLCLAQYILLKLIYGTGIKMQITCYCCYIWCSCWWGMLSLLQWYMYGNGLEKCF